jgi:8-oxo-dGTP diphosphatase
MSAVLVVTGLIFRDDTLLMCQRRKEKYLGLHWEFPGGKVDEGELLIDALRRELFEELQIESMDEIIYDRELMSYDNGITYDVTFFVVKHFTNEPVNTEFEQIRWITADELPALQHLSGNAKIINRLLTEGYPL